MVGSGDAMTIIVTNVDKCKSPYSQIYEKTSPEAIGGSGTVTPFWSAFLTGEIWLLLIVNL